MDRAKKPKIVTAKFNRAGFAQDGLIRIVLEGPEMNSIASSCFSEGELGKYTSNGASINAALLNYGKALLDRTARRYRRRGVQVQKQILIDNYDVTNLAYHR